LERKDKRLFFLFNWNQLEEAIVSENFEKKNLEELFELRAIETGVYKKQVMNSKQDKNSELQIKNNTEKSEGKVKF
jgi:hypothetical protein